MSDLGVGELTVSPSRAVVLCWMGVALSSNMSKRRRRWVQVDCCSSDMPSQRSGEGGSSTGVTFLARSGLAVGRSGLGGSESHCDDYDADTASAAKEPQNELGPLLAKIATNDFRMFCCCIVFQ